MLSLELLRREPERVAHALARRGEEAAVEQVLALDERRRAVVLQNDELRRQRNEASKAIGEAMRQPDSPARPGRANQVALEAQREEMRQVGERLKELDEQVRTLDEQLRGLMLTLPNLPGDDVPDGEDESGNVIVRQEGTPRAFDFTPLPHWDLAERLGVIDFQRGRQALRRPVLRAGGLGHPAPAGAGELDAGPAPHRARLPGDGPPLPGAPGGDGGQRQFAPVRREPLSRR